MNSQAQRLDMVSRQIQQRGISVQQIVQAFQTIPRHTFVPTAYEKYSYEDKSIVIGLNQTISQPYTVALMTQILQLKPSNSVLEI
jgi:protein-L-isoaspartate(D-aspartate) O-methyltransferase